MAVIQNHLFSSHPAMKKDYANPLLLLIVIALLSCKVSIGIEAPASLEVWILTLCVTGFIVNGLLSIAKAMARRKPLMAVVWCMVYLVFCSCAWVTMRQENDYRAEIASYNELNYKWQHESANPYTLYDAEGRSLLELAAILGKKMAVRGLLAQPEATQAGDIIMRAAVSAAENGRHEMLNILATQKSGFNFDTIIDGRTPLIGAVINDKAKCVELLLKLKANPNAADESGVSPLMHAVINSNRRIAALLIKHGANPYQKDSTGRDAISCSRSEEMDQILTPGR